MPAYVKLSVRLAIWSRDNYHCRYCGREVFTNAVESAPDKATLDHVIPRAAGGTNSQANLVTSCYACNQLKGCSLVGLGGPAPSLADVWPDLAPHERKLLG